MLDADIAGRRGGEWNRLTDCNGHLSNLGLRTSYKRIYTSDFVSDQSKPIYALL